MTTTTPDPEVRERLKRLASILSTEFPARAVPPNFVDVDRSFDGGAGLADVLWGLVSDVEKLARGNAEILAGYEADRQALRSLRSDVAGMRRLLGLDGLDRVLTSKAEADEQVGRLKAELDACGPRGNRRIETRLDHAQGRAGALAALLPGSGS